MTAEQAVSRGRFETGACWGTNSPKFLLALLDAKGSSPTAVASKPGCYSDSSVLLLRADGGCGGCLQRSAMIAALRLPACALSMTGVRKALKSGGGGRIVEVVGGMLEGWELDLVIAGVFVYFVVVLCVLAWWLLPGVRDRMSALGEWLWKGLRRTRTDLAERGAGVARAGTGGLRAGNAGVHAVANQVRGVKASIRLHWPLWVGAIAVLLLVPALALMLRHGWALETFDHTLSRAANPQVAALLQGEQLVPPQALPPELFLTREVIQARPLAGSASRQWDLLDSDFRQRLLRVFKAMREQHGLEMVLIEGYRSPQRQAELASLGDHVTKAGAGQSYHQYGLAADCAFLVAGRIVISETDPVAANGYALYGTVAESFGLTWGGSWRSIKDLGHVELRRAGVIGK